MSVIVNDYLINLTTSASLNQLYTVCQNPIDKSQRVCVNICDKYFFKPFEILIFANCIIYLKQILETENVILQYNERQKSNKYISDIGLVNFCRTNYVQPNTIDFIESCTAMPIRRVNSSTLTEYIEMTKRAISQFCKGKDLTTFENSIAELINNVNDHSLSLIDAYVFCQYYRSNNQIVICVADLGVGIPYNVRKYKKDETLSDEECVKWALRNGNTTQSTTHNAGLGLATLLNYTTDNTIKLKIQTGSIIFEANQEQQCFLKNSMNNFFGTIVEITLDINSLPDKDDEELDVESF